MDLSNIIDKSIIIKIYKDLFNNNEWSIFHHTVTGLY